MLSRDGFVKLSRASVVSKHVVVAARYTKFGKIEAVAQQLVLPEISQQTHPIGTVDTN